MVGLRESWAGAPQIHRTPKAINMISCESTISEADHFWDKNSPHLPLFAHFRRTGSQTAHLHLRRLEDSSQITAPPTGSQKGKW